MSDEAYTLAEFDALFSEVTHRSVPYEWPRIRAAIAALDAERARLQECVLQREEWRARAEKAETDAARYQGWIRTLETRLEETARRAEAAEAALLNLQATCRLVDAVNEREDADAAAALARVTEERDAAQALNEEDTKTIMRVMDEKGAVTKERDAGKGYLSPDEAKALAEKAWEKGATWGCLVGLHRAPGVRKEGQRALDVAALLGREG